MKLLISENDTSYIVNEDDSDYSGAMSSDEEGAMVMCNPEDDEDDFGNEMDDEIRSSMSVDLKKKETEPKPENSKDKKEKFYDDVYFNSSDEEGEDVKDQKKVKTDEELFYDASLDQKDEEWVNKKRKNYLKPGTKPGIVKPADSDTSAILNCPACMTVLCRDCQQHETYHDQFRAMFVFNCCVQTDEVLTYNHNKSNKKTKSKGESVSEESYNPVKCVVCQTKVGVYDSEEVYHFFNVLAT